MHRLKPLIREHLLEGAFYIVRVKYVRILFNGTDLINNYTHFAVLTLNTTLI